MRPWLVASLLAHAVWLAPLPRPALNLPAEPGGPLQVRLLPGRPISQPPPALPPPPRAPVPRAAREARTTPTAAPPLTAPALPTAAWPASGRWHYQLSWRGDAGDAVIDWQVNGDRYQLRLERQTGSRDLPTWTSDGRLGSAGLEPEHFVAGRRGRDHTRWRFADGQLTPQRGQAQAVPPGTQDRLSWIWQLAHQAQRLQPRPGERLSLQVAPWRGAPQTWELVVERDPEHPAWLLLRRVTPDGSLAEQRVWLDPDRNHLPVRLEMRYDEAERWSLLLAPAPPVAASAPSSP